MDRARKLDPINAASDFLCLGEKTESVISGYLGTKSVLIGCLGIVLVVTGCLWMESVVTGCLRAKSVTTGCLGPKSAGRLVETRRPAYLSRSGFITYSCSMLRADHVDKRAEHAGNRTSRAESFRPGTWEKLDDQGYVNFISEA